MAAGSSSSTTTCCARTHYPIRSTRWRWRSPLAQGTDGASSLKARTLALWVAENRLARAQLDVSAQATTAASGDETQAGMTLAWRQTVGATPNPAFRRIEIVVTEPGRPDYALARLVGYLPNR